MRTFSRRCWPVSLVCATAVFAAVPFWDAKPPAQWTVEELNWLLTDSPWAQMVDPGPRSSAPPLQVYIASADPMIQAEDRARAARKDSSTDPSWLEYRDYVNENAGKYLIVAVSVEDRTAFTDNAETKRMEQESRLRIGRRTYQTTGHFPPSSSDPYVRLVFPKEVREGDKILKLELYIPGASGQPYRQAEFKLKDMLYHGHPSY
jgi:hypothetical protein